MESVNEIGLYLFCGKIAAGKSTFARRLAGRPATLLVSEDHWTSNLFADEMKTIDDYTLYSERIRAAMGPHIVDILKLEPFSRSGFSGKHETHPELDAISDRAVRRSP